MNSAHFEILADFIKKEAGIIITSDNAGMIERRLGAVLKQHNFLDMNQFTFALKRRGNAELERAVVETLTINETSFFRDQRPFDTFRTVVLPKLCQNRPRDRKIRILCAAASTGQEPYTLALIAREEQRLLGDLKVEIVGVDIDTTALKKASEGRYSQFEVQRGVPVHMLMKYFDQEKSTDWRL
jgi:chemotaxis protein methyltransferase CheR